MARLAPPDYGVTDPTVWCEECAPEEPIPGWRTPLALAGWAGLIAILIALIVWGIIQLAHGAPPQEPTIVITSPPAAPSSAAPAVPTTQRRPFQQKTPSTTAAVPVPSTTDADTVPPLSTSSPSPGAFPLPQLPSVITLPALPVPGLPTEITLPPGL
jgi:hypothetical protein